jgi:hypothetical protein
MRILVWQWGRFGSGPRYALELARVLRDQCGHEALLSLAEGAELLQNPVGFWADAFRLRKHLGDDFVLVHLVRDPRAVCWSILRTLRKNTNDNARS